MDTNALRELLESVRVGGASVDDAIHRLRDLPYEDLGFAKLDHHRSLRNSFPEVIFCPGKETEHVVAIAHRLYEASGSVLATRATPEVAEAVQSALPQAEYHKIARVITIRREPLPEADSTRTLLIVAAGTADLPVAEEAVITGQMMGSHVERMYDVGVAGLHRLLDQRERLFSANVVVVVAGMEGALPSVIGGLVSRPVVAVPTSVGYGAHFNGLAPLLTMLNSCASGVAVMNIDNGFGAAYFAHLVNQK